VSLGGALLGSALILWDNDVAGTAALLPAVNFTQDALLVSIPPGDGANHTLQVRPGGSVAPLLG